ncbi:MAG: enoyl-CoA hydratase/isomerase family protein [Pseudomonadota bacterium]
MQGELDADLSRDGIVVASRGMIAEVMIDQPPLNYFDHRMIAAMAEAFDALGERDTCRAIVLTAAGRVFCAGADFGKPSEFNDDGEVSGAPGHDELKALYESAARLFGGRKPVIAAIHGAAIGGGFGLAMMADFRVTCSEARFSANFARLGIHPGFGLTVTLPRLVGPQTASLVFQTARRFTGDEAISLGLADKLVAKDEVQTAAFALAEEIATNAPLAVQATRAVLRAGLADQVRAATPSELEIQTALRKTADFREGIDAAMARRTPVFVGA